MAKILVTGGLGYLGSILVPRLLQLGHQVTVVDNCMYNQTPLLEYVHNDDLTIIRKDVNSLGWQFERQFYPQFDFVIPLACLTGAPICNANQATAKTVLVDPIKRMIDSHYKFENKVKIIYPNTNSGYGVGQTGQFCTEETPLNPISLYGKLKCEAEAEVLKYSQGISVRLATVFGASPRMRLDLLVNDFVYRAVNDKFVVLFEAHFKRNYIHVVDVARAFIHCIENFDTMKGQAYNVGLSDANLSKLELCQEIKKQVPDFTFLEAPIGEDVDKRDYIVSNEKLEATGFKPKVSLSDGIGELIKAYQIIKRNNYANI
jgi:nucleoside-diphosphate-sugar epimerase